MNFYALLLLAGFAAAHCGKQGCHCEKGCGPGYEGSYLGYHGHFKGGARKFVPVYERTTTEQKDCLVKGGRGHCHGRPQFEEPEYHREKRHCEKCKCEAGCGPGYEGSYLGYHGQFKGGARKYVPVYERTTTEQKDCLVKGGRGHCHGRPQFEEPEYHREKRHCEKCKCEAGCGPGYEGSYLGYRGHFKGGARKYVPVYERTTTEQKDCLVKGGRGHCHGRPQFEEPEYHREKRHCEKCKCEAGCGPGYEGSYLGYHGNFKGGARKFVPVYERTTTEQKDCLVKGGHKCHEEPPKPYHHEEEY